MLLYLLPPSAPLEFSIELDSPGKSTGPSQILSYYRQLTSVFCLIPLSNILIAKLIFPVGIGGAILFEEAPAEVAISAPKWNSLFSRRNYSDPELAHLCDHEEGRGARVNKRSIERRALRYEARRYYSSASGNAWKVDPTSGHVSLAIWTNEIRDTKERGQSRR